MDDEEETRRDARCTMAGRFAARLADLCSCGRRQLLHRYRVAFCPSVVRIYI